MRVASISGTTITLNTAAVSATSVTNTTLGAWGSLFALSPTSFIFCATNSTTGTSGSYYGVTVSGTTVTIGTVSVQANSIFRLYQRGTSIYRHGTTSGTASQLYGVQVDGSTIIAMLGNNGAIVAISISDTTLTFGTVFNTGTPQALLTDMATGLNIYSVGSASYSRLSVTGVTITASYTVAVVPTAVFSDTLTDKAANYGGTWYTWAGLPTLTIPVSTSKYANIASNVMRIYGNFS
jgi:hypothetical protein